MRTLLLLALLLTLPAADLVHGRIVLVSGEELVGWWDVDARVMTLPAGRRRYLPNNADIKASIAAPTSEAKPAKRRLPTLSSLPYGRLEYNGIEYTGWYIPRGAVCSVIVASGPSMVTLSEGWRLVSAAAAPGPMPEMATTAMTYWIREDPEMVEAYLASR